MRSTPFSVVCNLGGTYKSTEVERSRLEVVIKDEPRCDWDGICNIESGDRECKDGIDSLRARERKKAQEGGNPNDKPDGIHWRASETVHAVQDT